MKLQDKDLKNKYADTPDEELILRIREGENGITEYILDKYKNLVRSKAKSMYILGADSEDLIQEGMIGLFKAYFRIIIGTECHLPIKCNKSLMIGMMAFKIKANFHCSCIKKGRFTMNGCYPSHSRYTNKE